MAIGPSLGELTGLIQDPGPIQYRDFGLDEHEQARQKLLLQRAQLGDERAKVQLQAMLQQQAERGRNARADQRMGLQRDKFGFEQKKFGAEADQRHQGQLEAAYAQLRDAQDRGDAQGVSFARQAIERLGEHVEGGAPAPQGSPAPTPMPGETAPQPPPPPAPADQGSPLAALSGMPRPRAARVGLPGPSEMHPGPSTDQIQLEEGPQQPFQPFVKGGNSGVDLPELGGPAGGPPPQLPAAASFMAPEAGGAVTSGLARLGGRIPPPGGPPAENSAAAPQAAGFSKVFPGATPQAPVDQNPGNIAALGAQFYPKQAPQAETPKLAEPPPSASPAPAAAPPAGPTGAGLSVLRGDKPVLTLGGADAPNQVRATLQSLADNARTPEEKRSAKIAMDTALGAVQRLGVKEAVDIGLKAYDREQNNNRKTRVGTGKGVGESNFGGTGLGKAELGVRGDTDAAYRHIFDKTVTSGQLSKLNQSAQALSQLTSTASAGTATGDVMALKSAIKLTDERISDADFRVMAGAGGVWSTLSTKLKQFAVDADAGRIDERYMADLRKTAAAAAAALRNRRQELADEVANQMLAAPEFRRGDPAHEQEEREYYANAARNEMLGRRPAPRGKPQQAAATPAPAAAAPSAPAPAAKPAPGGKKKIPMENLF